MSVANSTEGGSLSGKNGDRPSKHKLFEEMKRKIAKYKAELEIERSKIRHFQKDKMAEMKQLREQYEYEKTTLTETYQARCQADKQSELTRLKESLSHEKDVELRQVLKYKDEEVKQLKRQFNQEKEDAVKVALEVQRKALGQKSDQSDIVHKLQKEVKHLKAAKQELEEKYRLKSMDEKDKAAQVRKLRLELDVQRGLKREVSRDGSSLSLAGDTHEKGLLDRSMRKSALSHSSEGLSDASNGNNGDTKSTPDKADIGRRRSSETAMHSSKVDNRISGLKAENESLKRKLSEQGPVEEKMRKLKKRNAELAAIARRLEQKVTTLQQSHTKKTDESANSHDVDHMKKVFARQRAKDLAEHAKGTLAKEKEIDSLRQQCQRLMDQLGQLSQPVENNQMYEDKEELENIIKQSAKERLRLECNLVSRSGTTVQQQQTEASRKKVMDLEETVASLQKESDLAKKVMEDNDRLEEEIKQLKDSAVKTTKEYNQVAQECHSLRTNLSQMEEERDTAKNRTTELQDELSSLQSLNAELAITADKYKNVDEELKRALKSVKEGEATASQLRSQKEADEKRHLEEVEQLQVQVLEMKKSAHEQDDLLETNRLELSRLGDQCSTLQRENLSLAQARVTLEQEKERVIREMELAMEEKERVEEERDEVVKASAAKEAEERLRLDNLVNICLQTEVRECVDYGQQMSAPCSPVDEVESQLVSLGVQAGVYRDTTETGLQTSPAASPVDVERLAHLQSVGVQTELVEGAAGSELTAVQSTPVGGPLIEEADASHSNGTKKSTKPLTRDMSASRLLNMSGVQVYKARYNYDPLQYSPNDNPEAELPLMAGDYVYVLGYMDEDGFYEAELINGQRGVVPSTFIEKVDEDDSFQALMALGGLPSDDSQNTSLLNDLEFNSSDESELTDLPYESPIKHNRDSFISITEEPDVEQVIVPSPKKLTLERQLSNSVLIRWTPPSGVDLSSVTAYHIYVDNQLKTSISANERTAALVEGVKAKQAHRICVRTVTVEGLESHDQECTITIGKVSPLAPTQLKASNITSTSADITWFPGNSNYSHLVLVNGAIDRVLPPGAFKYSVTNLNPSSEYSITVCCKNWPEDKLPAKSIKAVSTLITFKTLPGGLPEAPVGVQVEAGSQPGTLLVTWLPVTLNTAGTSNGAVVTGYMIYVDKHKVKQLDSSTVDHAVIELSHLGKQSVKHVTVRTLSTNVMSAESESVEIPVNLWPSVSPKVRGDNVQKINIDQKHSQAPTANGPIKAALDDQVDHQQVIEAAKPQPLNSSSPDADSLMEMVNKNMAILNSDRDTSPQSYREIIDSSSSELSDIAEVEEEDDFDDLDLSLPGLNDEKSLHKASDNKPMNGSAQENEDLEGQPKVGDTRHSPLQPVHSNSTLETVFKPVEPAHCTQSSAFRTVEPKARPASVDGPITQSSTPPNSSRVVIPQIEITKTSSVEANSTSEEESENDHCDSVEKDEEVKSYQLKPDVSPVNSDNQSVHQPETKHHASSHKPAPSADERDVEHNRTKGSENSLQESDMTEYEDDTLPGGSELTLDDSVMRVFVALFDYDPTVMSPNPDAIEEELPFKEGQLIKVYGEKDEDGFYRGEANGRTGYVPCNMVSEFDVEDPQLAIQLLENGTVTLLNNTSTEQGSPSLSGDALVGAGDRLTDPSVKMTAIEEPSTPKTSTPDQYVNTNMVSGVKRRMIALYDYDPSELSPNVDADVELSFQAGDILTVLGDMDEDGFYMAELQGQRGLAPSNFLQEVPQVTDDEYEEGGSVVSSARSIESFTFPEATQTDEKKKQSEKSQKKSSAKKDKKKKKNKSSEEDAIVKASPTVSEDGKDKKKKSLFSKGKSIFKKLAK